MQEEGFIRGYASVFNMVDSQNDEIKPYAFITNNKDNIKFLWQHQTGEPIGVITTLKEDEYGLYFEAKLILEVARAREAYALIKEGAIASLSIGYVPVKYYHDYERNVRVIEEVKLYEISLVTFPANENTIVQIS